MATRYTAHDPMPDVMPARLARALAEVRAELDMVSAARPEAARKAHWAHDTPWAWFGSVVMLFHGIELGREPSDLDVFVDPWVWVALNYRGWALKLPDPADPPFLTRRVGGVDVCAFYRWTAQDPEVNADHCRIVAECLYGHYVTPLPVIRTHKAMTGKHEGERWEKHRTDVQLIDAYFAEHPPYHRGRHA